MQKFIKGFGYAFKGLRYALNTQLNIKVHLVCAIAAIISGFYFNISGSEWLWIIAAIGLVILAELINTAIETVVDLASPQRHPKAGTAKDLAAAAVLVSAALAVCIGLIIFLPKLMAGHAA